ncbi:hypothetical protein JCM16303_006465 [Sporobolomyces ruberrimus]
MPRKTMAPSPLHLGTSLVVKTLKKKKSWFSCNAGSFEDDCPRITSEPFISLPLDPFARYTIPSGRPKTPRFSPRPRTPVLEFPTPPPRSPTTYRQKSLPPSPASPVAPGYRSEPPDRAEWTAFMTQRNQDEFKTKMVGAKLAALSLACTEYIDELDEWQQRDSAPTATLRDDASDRGSIFTLFGDAKEWEEFEEALFFLRPSRSTSFTTNSSSLPSSHPSSSSIAFSSTASSTSSVYSTMTTPATSCEGLYRSC